MLSGAAVIRQKAHMNLPKHADSIVTGGRRLDQCYDRTSILLHWTMAGMILLLWAIATTIGSFPEGQPRIAARSLHIVLGASLGMLLLVRMTWRIGWGRRLPPAHPGIIGNLAKLTHWWLYILLAATVALGMTNAWVRGDTLIGLFTIPALAPGDHALKKLIENLHGIFATVLLIAAGLHALAGLVHHFVLRDNVLRRMLPRGTVQKRVRQ